MVMPVMDGEELTKIIKREYPQIEIIILSSFSDFDYVRSTFQHGIADYILKPQLKEREILKTLKKAAEKIPGFTLISKKTTISIETVIDKIFAGYDHGVDVSVVKQAFPYPHYCLFGIDFRNSIKHHHVDLPLIANEIDEKMKESFIDSVYQLITIDKNVVVFLLNFEQRELEMIKQFVQKIANSNFFINLDIDWVLTEPFDKFTLLKKNYEQNLLSLINYRFIT